jgi:hypothetical protein
MTETTTAKQVDKEEEIFLLRMIGIFLFLLSLAASIVIMLLPVRVLLRGTFPGNPMRALWLLFIFGMTFGVGVHALGATKHRRWKFWKFAGVVKLGLGLLCAIEIFLLTADREISTTSLWWLFGTLIVLGTNGVYLPERGKRLEAAEAKRKAEEVLIRARRTSPKFFRFKVQRYLVSENKTFVCRN